MVHGSLLRLRLLQVQMFVEKLERATPGILASLRGAGRSSAKGHHSACQRMRHVIDVHRRGVRPANAVARAGIREVLVRERKVIAAQSIDHRVSHLGRVPYLILPPGDQKHGAANALDLNGGPHHFHAIVRPRIGPGEWTPAERP
jgi:hypothetical protein